MSTDNKLYSTDEGVGILTWMQKTLFNRPRLWVLYIRCNHYIYDTINIYSTCKMSGILLTSETTLNLLKKVGRNRTRYLSASSKHGNRYREKLFNTRCNCLKRKLTLYIIKKCNKAIKKSLVNGQ